MDDGVVFDGSDEYLLLGDSNDFMNDAQKEEFFDQFDIPLDDYCPPSREDAISEELVRSLLSLDDDDRLNGPFLVDLNYLRVLLDHNVCRSPIVGLCVVGSPTGFDEKDYVTNENVAKRYLVSVCHCVMDILSLCKNNLMIMGGAVLKAMMGVYERREWGLGSDVDFFFFGIDEEQAFEKLDQIIRYLEKDKEFVYVSRTKRIVQVVMKRTVLQFILRVYESKEEVLDQVDLHCCGCGFSLEDGFFMTKSCAFSVATGTIIVDPAKRRGRAYEYRLHKYNQRGFTLILPSMVFIDLPKNVGLSLGSMNGYLTIARGGESCLVYHTMCTPLGQVSGYDEAR